MQIQPQPGDGEIGDQLEKIHWIVLKISQNMHIIV